MFPLANLMGFGNPVEIAIIAGVVVLLFGGAKLAGFGKSMGQGIKEFKKATHDDDDETVPPAAAPAPPPTIVVTKTEEK